MQVTQLQLPKTVAALEAYGTRRHATSCGRLRLKKLETEGLEGVVLEEVYLYGYLGPLSWKPYKGEERWRPLPSTNSTNSTDLKETALQKFRR
jgi:hypothetical protein